MAKIKSVSLNSIPDIINVGDDVSDITVKILIEFHPIDINIKMEYLLHIFVYDIHGNVDVPVIIGNWDDSNIIGVSQGGKDDFMGKEIISVKAEKDTLEIEAPIALKLGNLKGSSSYHKRKLEVFATLIPAIGRASKWSEPFESQLMF